MADLDAISQSLKQHRKDLDDQFDQTAARSSETSDILNKIEDLRRRSEATNRAFAGKADPATDEEKKE